jgi:CBS domain-containing protein
MSSHQLQPTLSNARVDDVMRPGIISCTPDTDLPTIAATMAEHRVHAVVVGGIEQLLDGREHLSWGLVTALDLVGATLPGAAVPSAGALASTEIVTVGVDEPLERAAQLMTEHQLTHLLVVSEGLPIGIVSTLDVVGRLGAGDL